MRSSLLLLILGILLGSTNHSNAQYKTLKALKLSPQTTKAMQKVRVKAFTVSKEGILKANRGYHIVYKPGNNRVWVKRVNLKPGRISTQDETVDIGNGFNLVA